MNFLRRHWYDTGASLSVVVIVYIFVQRSQLTAYQSLMWLSLVSLFLHQSEEYRIAGTFPGMINRVIYHSDMPDRYPLNSNTAMLINVVVGWGTYLLAALLAEKAVWLGMATILVSFGNIIAHTFLFNIKGKTFYNAGLVTCWLCLAPCVYFFFFLLCKKGIATPADFYIGIPLGIILNIAGILKMIDWLKDRNTTYVFETRNLLPQDRKQKS